MSKSLLEQLEDKFLIDDGCWEWTAAKQVGGYGVLNVAGRTTLAHRVVYELLVGPVPEGTEIDHLCRNRACVRPDHLDPVSKKVNIARGASLPADNARKTHCIRGHEFTPENLGKFVDGWRRCRICHAERERRYRAKRRAS